MCGSIVVVGAALSADVDAVVPANPELSDTLGLSLLRIVPATVLSAFFRSLARSFRGRASLQLENLSLRHQVGVLQRSVKRPKLTTADRLLWVWLSHLWADWRAALVIVQPATVIA